MVRRRSRTRKARPGVTLLELILALSLSVLVVAAIGMAINLHFKMLDVRRTNLEEMQVVRAVTKRLTDDIRNSVQKNEPDLSGLQTAFANAMQAAQSQAAATAASGPVLLGGATGGQNTGGGNSGGGAGGGNNAGGGQGAGQGGQGGGGQAGGGQGGGGQGGQNAPGQGSQQGQSNGGGQSGQNAGGQSSGASGATPAAGGSSGAGSSSSAAAGGATATDAAAGTTASAASTSVQLIGSAAELRFDISRLPRVDQYEGIISAKGEQSAVDLPSDVKTIAYFIRSESSANSFADNPRAPGGEASPDGTGRGLMRAETDRAVTTWAETNGGAESIYSSAQLLAEEVVGLGFEYYDGTDWLTEWDSSSQGMPRAIRIWLSIKPTYGMSEKELAQAAAGKEPPATDFYFVVSLPTATLITPPSPTETTDTSSSSSASSSGATQGGTP